MKIKSALLSTATYFSPHLGGRSPSISGGIPQSWYKVVEKIIKHRAKPAARAIALIAWPLDGKQ